MSGPNGQVYVGRNPGDRFWHWWCSHCHDADVRVVGWAAALVAGFDHATLCAIVNADHPLARRERTP